jgi:hypothetical protein
VGKEGITIEAEMDVPEEEDQEVGMVVEVVVNGITRLAMGQHHLAVKMYRTPCPVLGGAPGFRRKD